MSFDVLWFRLLGMTRNDSECLGSPLQILAPHKDAKSLERTLEATWDRIAKTSELKMLTYVNLICIFLLTLFVSFVSFVSLRCQFPCVVPKVPIPHGVQKSQAFSISVFAWITPTSSPPRTAKEPSGRSTTPTWCENLSLVRLIFWGHSIGIKWHLEGSTEATIRMVPALLPRWWWPYASRWSPTDPGCFSALFTSCTSCTSCIVKICWKSKSVISSAGPFPIIPPCLPASSTMRLCKDSRVQDQCCCSTLPKIKLFQQPWSQAGLDDFSIF